MQVCDSSAIIHAWDNYPIEKFPMLWEWFKSSSESADIVYPWVVYDEVKKNSLDCYNYLLAPTTVSTHKVQPSNDILSKAAQIKSSLEINMDQYHGGVGENDIYVVSTAAILGVPLVNNEAVQNALPRKKANYKIPAVCNLSGVSVASLDVLSLIKNHAPVCG